MKTLKGIGLFVVASFLMTGCAINRPLIAPSEETPRSEEFAKKYAEKYEEVLGELRFLRASLASLRSEIKELRRLEDGIVRLRSEMERLKNLEKHLSSLRSDIENLRGLEKSISSLQWEVERIRSFSPYVSTLQAEVARLGEELQSLDMRRPLGSYKLPPEISLCGERVPLEDRDVWENLDREFLSILANEAQVLLWMKRARRYFPHIEKRLKETGLPDDLKYVAVIESGLRAQAVSVSGAAGVWQFIPSTGERYEMRKSRGVDERFDFFKATEGAIAYFKMLYDEFGSWALAMAAYNAGENRVRKEILLQGVKDYYRLSLPAETERFVYKIVVAKILLSDPRRYGLRLDEDQYYSALSLDRVEIEISKPLPLVEVAKAVGVSYKKIKDLNPHLNEESAPTGRHFLNLPPGSTERFNAFFSAWQGEVERNRSN